MAFIQWRKHNTTSAKGGYSIAASIKSSFCKGAKQLGMQHLVVLDAAVLYKTCRRGHAEGGSEGASSVSIRMVCYWEHRCANCTHPAMLHAYKCMVYDRPIDAGIEFKRSVCRPDCVVPTQGGDCHRPPLGWFESIGGVY